MKQKAEMKDMDMKLESDHYDVILLPSRNLVID